MMRPLSPSFTTRVATAVLGAAIALSLPGVARADVDPKVQEHFQAGNSLYEEGRYKDALVEYDAAYEISKNWKILFNRGQCLVMLKREPDAIVSFEQYLHDGGDQVPPERRTQVENDIKKLKGRLGSVVVNGAPPGSRVEIDGFFAGNTPLQAPIPAGSGYHDISITAPGGKPATGSVKVIAGEKVFFEVKVVAEPGTAPAPAPVAVPDAPPPSPPPVALPARAPGGLPAPGFHLALQLGTALPTPDYQYGERKAMGAAELGASWRPSGFWELGIFAGGASGRYSIDQSVRNTNDPSLGTANVGPNADYSWGTIGLRARMHLVRTKKVDGWFGVDVGGWTESWKFTGEKAFDYHASSAAFGLGLGFDVPLSRVWAVGVAARFLAASASNGARSNCVDSNLCSGGLPGETSSGGTQSTARGFFDFGIRLVYSIPTGSNPEPKPADPPATALLNEPPIW